MIKMLGATLVLLTATLAGWLRARQYANRPHQIREMILALKRLETEIMYGFTPLPDALQRIADQHREPVKGVFALTANNMRAPHNWTAQKSLQDAIDHKWGYTSMKKPEREVMNQLSYTLGTSDRQHQIGHIATAVCQLESEEIAARDEQSRYEKMSKSLGLLCGAFIVILFY